MSDEHTPGYERREESLSLQERVAILTERSKNLAKEISTKVSNAEFQPIKLLVYGMTGMFLVAVLTAILKLVIKGA